MTSRPSIPRVDPSGLWGFTEIAEHTGLARSTVKQLRGELPGPAGRAGHRLVWHPDAIRQWSNGRNTRARWWSRSDVERYTRRSWAELEQTPSWSQFPDAVDGRWERAVVIEWWEAHLDRADGRWDSQDVALHLGLSWDTIRKYRLRGTLPEADGVDGGHPWWWPVTIAGWDAARKVGRRTGRTGRPLSPRVRERRWR